jgi:glycosyltransferase involved in cell wall biosynthesis
LIVFVNCSFDPAQRDPQALLDQHPSWRAFAAAVGRASGEPVAVVQRFSCDGALRAGDVEYKFVADGGPPAAPPWHLATRVARAVRALEPRVVHVEGMIYPLQVRLLRAVLPRRVPVLVQDHGGIHAGSAGFRRRRWRLLHRLGLRAADGFLFSTAGQAEPWKHARIIGPRQTIHEVLEASTDLADQPLVAGARAPGSPALLWVGRLDDNKDPLTILAGFEQARLPGAALSMAFTDDQLLPQVRACIAGSPFLAGRVHLLGKVERRALPALYGSADLFVLGSHHESAGYALLEALAFGVTPAVSSIPSFRALTHDGRLGALFPVGDAGALAEALRRLAGTDLGARRPQVRAHFARHLSWAAVGARAATIYRAAGSAPPRR